MVRWWALTHRQTYAEAQKDPRLLGLWDLKNKKSARGKFIPRNVRETYLTLGVIDQQADGSWEYTNAFQSWWLKNG